MHIAAGNLLLLSRAGVVAPAGFADAGTLAEIRRLETRVTSKLEVMDWLKRSFDAVEAEYPKADLETTHTFFGGEKRSRRGIYLRILAHLNEHLGQSIAYARMNGIKPPWS